MIIKSHVRGGYRAAAQYLQDVGLNEEVRLVEISDPGAKTLDDAFRNMWMVGRSTRARKPLHHVSINPYKDERLTGRQVLRICARLEEKYGYKHGDHQRVIVEHIKDGRQHFHVMWNRVSLDTGRPIWPGHHWNKSKQAAREMEIELGLKTPSPRRGKGRKCARRRIRSKGSGMIDRAPIRPAFKLAQRALSMPPNSSLFAFDAWPARIHASYIPRTRYVRDAEREAALPALPRPKMSRSERLLAWAWENRRADILAQFGIYVSFGL